MLSVNKGLILYDMLGVIRVLYSMGWYTSLGGLGMTYWEVCLCLLSDECMFLQKMFVCFARWCLYSSILPKCQQHSAHDNTGSFHVLIKRQQHDFDTVTTSQMESKDNHCLCPTLKLSPPFRTYLGQVFLFLDLTTPPDVF